MTTDERELKFDRLWAIAKRIVNAKHYLFTGEPYRSPLKLNKDKTFKKLIIMHNENIMAVGKLFRN